MAMLRGIQKVISVDANGDPLASVASPGSTLEHALDEILSTYGDITTVKPKSLHKFGRTENADSDNATTVMTLPGSTQYTETYVSDNLIDSISSANAGDTEPITIEGHTISGGVFTFVVQMVTLTGQTVAPLTTPLARVSRAVNIGSTDLTGPVYVFESDGVTVTAGVPQTDAAVHLMMAAGKNNSQKAATTFSNVDYGIITELYASSSKGGAAAIINIDLLIRPVGSVFRTVHEFTINTSVQPTAEQTFMPFIVAPKNSDVILQATSSANNSFVTAGFDAFIATTA